MRHVKELIARVGGDGTVFVNIESLDGPQGLPKAEALAPRLASEFLAMGPQTIRSVDENLRPVTRRTTALDRYPAQPARQSPFAFCIERSAMPIDGAWCNRMLRPSSALRALPPKRSNCSPRPAIW